MLGYPWVRKQFASRSSLACVRADGAAGGGDLPGSRRWQALWAAWNAGEDGLMPGTFRKLRLSGKFDTPCKRMQRAKLRVARWASAWFGLVRPPELGGPDELEPQAATTMATAIAATAEMGLDVPGRTPRVILAEG
jgi:hypothetical protein